MNPLNMIKGMMGNMNPKNMAMNMLKNNTNPIFNNLWWKWFLSAFIIAFIDFPFIILLNVEEFARNYMKSQGKDFDQEFNNFKSMFK